MLRRSTIRVCLAFCALPFALASASAEDAIKFGASLPLSGNAAAWGHQARAALRLAETEINAAGPINGSKVEILIKDDGSDANQAVTVNRQLIGSDKVAVVLGPHLSTQAQVTVPLAKRDQVPFVETAAAVPGLLGPARPWATRIALIGQDANMGPFGAWLKKHNVK